MIYFQIINFTFNDIYYSKKNTKMIENNTHCYEDLYSSLTTIACVYFINILLYNSTKFINIFFFIIDYFLFYIIAVKIWHPLLKLFKTIISNLSSLVRK